MKYYLTLFFALSISAAHAQHEMKYGEIDEANLKMTTFAADPEAGAVVLGEEMKIIFGFRAGPYVNYYHHVRIKILDKKAFEEGDISIPFQGVRMGEDITNIKAQTWNWENGVAVATEVKKEDIFEEKESKYQSLKKFAFPNVKEGSILEFYYERYSEHYTDIQDFYVQRAIPVIWSNYSVKVIDILKYQYEVQGNHPPTIATEAPVSIHSVNRLKGREYKWVFENVPALKPEPFITSMKDYYACVKMRLAVYAPPNNHQITYIHSWEFLSNEYHLAVAEKNHLKRGYIKKIWENAKPLLNDTKDTLDQARILYDFVQKNIKWNGYHEINPDHDANDCFEKGEGSNSEINIIYLALLLEAGIKAYPMLISTRDNGKAINTLPYLYQFNQTLVVILFGGKPYIVDASHQNYPMDVLHTSNLNGKGWVLTSRYSGLWLTVVPSQNSEILLSILNLDEEGNMTGTLEHIIKGYTAQNLRQSIEKYSKKEYTDPFFLENLPNARINNLVLEGLAYKDEKIKANMDFECKDLAQTTGDMMYVSPFPRLTYQTNPFKSEKRLIPVDMKYGFTEHYVLKLTIPESMAVEELPKSVKIVLANNAGSLEYAAAANDQVISIIMKVKLEETYHSVEEYTLLREFIDRIVSKQQEQIVLKKR